MDEIIRQLLSLDNQATSKVFLNEISRLMEQNEQLREMLDKCKCETNLRKLKKVKKSSRILK